MMTQAMIKKLTSTPFLQFYKEATAIKDWYSPGWSYVIPASIA